MSDASGILLDVLSIRVCGFLASALLIVPITGCGMFESGPSEREVVSSFVRALSAGDNGAAARQTDSPKQARAALKSVRDDLSAEKLRASLRSFSEDGEEVRGRASLDMNWELGQGRAWQYRSDVEVVDTDEGNKVRWTPSVIHPKLRAEQSLSLVDQPPEAKPILAAGGQPLMEPTTLINVNLDAQQAGDVEKVAGQLAGPLGEIDSSITAESILGGVRETPDGQPYSVVSLREGDYQQVKSRIYDLPGVRFTTRSSVLPLKEGFGSQVLAGVGKEAEERADQRAGWRVATVDQAGNEVAVVHDKPPRPVDPITTTLDSGIQNAAESAVDPIPEAAMIVAMRPSNGEVVAVAQNGPADEQGPIALSGQYPPGSTFKIVTAASALNSGSMNKDTPVQCPAKKTFDGREIPNDHDFELGQTLLIKAFAESCNTTFAQLATDQPADALTKTARQFGVGVDFDMPGSITITGDVPPAEETVLRAANGIGQGKVVASPFGMALASASVVNGSMPTPKLIEGAETKADHEPAPLSPEMVRQLKPMMRDVVQSGTAKGLSGSGAVSGKTGTAQYGDGKKAHGWFVGFRDDLSFAVLLTDAGSSKPAVATTRAFLDQLP